MRQIWRGNSDNIHRLIDRFKAFAVYGSILDLAIYALFMDIVYSLISNILVPFVGLMLFGINLSSLTITLKNAVVAQGGTQILQEAVTLNIGDFVKTIINFILVAIPFFFIAQIFLTPRRDYEQGLAQKSDEQKTSGALPKIASKNNSSSLVVADKIDKATRLSDKKSQEALLLEIRDLLRQLTAK